ncbi:MAG: amino acid ABC transporter substrate-binding protein [Cetobacterium sp.]
MKKFICIIFILFFTNIFAIKKINIGLDDTFAPMGFRGKTGEIEGFDIDLAREVCKRLDLKPNFIPCDWDGIIFMLNTNRIDLIWNGLTVTPKRKEQMLFSENYLQDGQLILVNRNSNIKNINQLENKILGVQMGSASYFALEKSDLSKNIKAVQKYYSNVEALLDLEAGRISGVVIDEVVGRYYLGKTKKLEGFNLDVPKENFAVGMRKTDKELQLKINKSLKEIHEDGTFNKIYDKWFTNKEEN